MSRDLPSFRTPGSSRTGLFRASSFAPLSGILKWESAAGMATLALANGPWSDSCVSTWNTSVLVRAGKTALWDRQQTSGERRCGAKS